MYLSDGILSFTTIIIITNTLQPALKVWQQHVLQP